MSTHTAKISTPDTVKLQHEEPAAPPPNLSVIARVKEAYANAVAKINSGINTCVEKVQSLVGRVKYAAVNLLSSISFELTETKIKQVISLAFASYFALGAKILAGGIPSTFSQWAVASPLLALSAGAVWYALTLVDYESPDQLEKIRKVSQKLPLNDLLHLHGWQTIFRYAILSPDDFHKAFCHLGSSLSFKDLHAIHTKAKKELETVNSSSNGCQHKIPSLAEWKRKFTQETKDLTPEQMLTLYPDLLSLNLIASDEMALFKEVQSLLEAKQREKDAFAGQISEFLKETEKKSLEAIQHAQNTLADIERVREAPVIGKEKLPFLGDKYDEFRRKANEEHEKRMEEIQARLNLIQKNSASPIKA